MFFRMLQRGGLSTLTTAKFSSGSSLRLRCWTRGSRPGAPENPEKWVNNAAEQQQENVAQHEHHWGSESGDGWREGGVF